MYTYFLIGLPFICLVLLVDILILKTKVVFTKACWIVMSILILLTAIFNQILTGLPIVTYNESKITGLYLGYIPIEDFLYVIAATIGLGSLRSYHDQG